jgi:alkylation response protein AidB-like acyl-CoA dehydrogenase
VTAPPLSRSNNVEADLDRAMLLRQGDFSLGEEQRALREAFDSFLARECPSERVRGAEPLGFDEDLWEQFVAMRTVAMGVAAGAGGDGAGLVELALVAEEVGRRLAPVPFVETAVAARLLSRCGPSARGWADAAVNGSELVTMALHPLRAGEPQLVPGGAVADAIVGLVDREVVVVSSPTPFEHVANHGLAPLARLDVGAAGLVVTSIGSDPPALGAFGMAVREWQLMMAAVQVGVAAGALRPAVDFASNRVAFGTPIATFQAISHPLADCYIGLVGARRLVWRAAWLADHEPDTNRQLIPMALLHAARVAMKTATIGVHTLGGLGFCVESDLPLYFRRAKGWANVLGDPARQLQVVADEMYGPVPER